MIITFLILGFVVALILTIVDYFHQKKVKAKEAAKLKQFSETCAVVTVKTLLKYLDKDKLSESLTGDPCEGSSYGDL